MRLTTIWSIRPMAFAERIRRTRDVLNMYAAARIPKRIKYWAFIQAGSSAMGPDTVVPDARFMDLLKRLEGEPHS